MNECLPFNQGEKNRKKLEADETVLPDPVENNWIGDVRGQNQDGITADSRLTGDVFGHTDSIGSFLKNICVSWLFVKGFGFTVLGQKWPNFEVGIFHSFYVPRDPFVS